MAGLDPHWGYVIVSYAVSALVLAGLAGFILFDARRQKHLVESLEADGGPRRRRASGPAGGAGAP